MLTRCLVSYVGFVSDLSSAFFRTIVFHHQPFSVLYCLIISLCLYHMKSSSAFPCTIVTHEPLYHSDSSSAFLSTLVTLYQPFCIPQWFIISLSLYHCDSSLACLCTVVTLHQPFCTPQWFIISLSLYHSDSSSAFPLVTHYQPL